MAENLGAVTLLDKLTLSTELIPSIKAATMIHQPVRMNSLSIISSCHGA
jgi:hypothetical protein